MPRDRPATDSSIGWIFAMFGSCSALIFLYFVIIPECTGLSARNGGSAVCSLNLPVLYVCALIFLAGTILSGYFLARSALRDREGQPPAA